MMCAASACRGSSLMVTEPDVKGRQRRRVRDELRDALAVTLVSQEPGVTVTQPAPKGCTVRVRNAAVIEPCGTKFPPKGDCPNKANHLHPMVTGFCDSGWHEGQKINKPTCKFWLNCPCNCHTQLSVMFSMSDRERVVVDNSTYVPDRGGFVVVTRADVAQTVALKIDTARLVPSAAPGILPSSIVRDFAPTATGRAGKGELETWVREVTDFWAVDFTPGRENCTPQYVAREIMRIQRLDKPPSSGAVDAVFKRWTAYGFAVIETRPTRFVRYTVDGIKLGLEALKERHKRQR